MLKAITSRRLNSGALLIEALIAMLIFSVGILGLMGLQATVVQASTDAKYRSEAALLANKLIGSMWVSDRTQATFQATYSGGIGGTDGAGYAQWVQGANTGNVPSAGSVFQILPGAQANPPTVRITSVPAGVAANNPSSLVTITIFWQAPNETITHNYVTVVQIGG